MLEFPIFFKAQRVYYPFEIQIVVLTNHIDNCFEGFWWETKCQGRCSSYPDVNPLEQITKNKDIFETYCLNKWSGYSKIEVLNKKKALMELL